VNADFAKTALIRLGLRYRNSDHGRQASRLLRQTGLSLSLPIFDSRDDCLP